MIKLKEVVKRYGTVNVVDRVSLRIPKGKITSLIGPNGAGKSTLLAVISRLIKKEAGEVYIDGKELGEWDNNLLSQKISVLRQQNETHLKLTVGELVSFGRFPYARGNLGKRDWELVDQALAYLKLDGLRNEDIRHLSGGQRQRAYLAMVIAQDTDYVLLDEPLNNLDMRHAVEIMKILRSLVTVLGKTVVIVLHDINFASCYSDYIVAMRDGRIVKEGDQDLMMNAHVLQGIYNLEFNIAQINGQKICVYY